LEDKLAGKKFAIIFVFRVGRYAGERLQMENSTLTRIRKSSGPKFWATMGKNKLIISVELNGILRIRSCTIAW